MGKGEERRAVSAVNRSWQLVKFRSSPADVRGRQEPPVESRELLPPCQSTRVSLARSSCHMQPLLILDLSMASLVSSHSDLGGPRLNSVLQEPLKRRDRDSAPWVMEQIIHGQW